MASQDSCDWADAKSFASQGAAPQTPRMRISVPQCAVISIVAASILLFVFSGSTASKRWSERAYEAPGPAAPPAQQAAGSLEAQQRASASASAHAEAQYKKVVSENDELLRKIVTLQAQHAKELEEERATAQLQLEQLKQQSPSTSPNSFGAVMTKRMKHPAERPGVLFQLTNTDPPYWWCNFCCGPHADVLKRVNVEHATLFGEIESFAGVARGDSQIVVDVGANIGQFCLLAASRGHRVLAFEPVSINLNHLKSSLAANEFRHPVELYEAAVGDRDGTADLFVPADFGASDQASSASKSVSHLAPLKETVRALRLSDVLKEDVFLIKIDVQGFEHNVLKGAADYLRSHTARFLYLEFTVSYLRNAGTEPRDVLLLIDSLGYEIRDKGPHGAVIDARTWPLHDHTNTDLFCVCRSCGPQTKAQA